ncbi:tetratricopeptide repeat protein [Nonomuraea sp. NPDC003214]
MTREETLARCWECGDRLPLSGRVFFDTSDSTKETRRLLEDPDLPAATVACSCGAERWLPLICRDAATAVLFFVADEDRTTLTDEYDETLVNCLDTIPPEVRDMAWHSPYFVVAGVPALRELIARGGRILASLRGLLMAEVPSGHHAVMNLQQVAAAYARADRPGEAFDILRRAPLAKVSSPDYWVAYGKHAVAAGSLDAAEAAFARAATASRELSHLPLNPLDADESLADVSGVRLPQLAAAVEERRRLLMFGPEPADEEAAERMGYGIGAIQAALIDLPDQDVEALESLHSSSLGSFRNWIDGSHARKANAAWLKRMCALGKERARGDFDAEQDPERLLRTGEVLAQAEEPGLALALLRRAEHTGPPEVRFAAARWIGSMLSASDAEEAERWLRKALGSRRSDTRALAHLGLALIAQRRGMPELYHEQLLLSARLGGDRGSPEALYLLALREAELGREETQMAYLTQLARGNYGTVTEVAGVVLADLCLRRGEPAQAYEFAMLGRHSLKVEIVMASMFIRGMVLSAAGRIREARQLLGAVAVVPGVYSETAQRWVADHPES